MSVKIIRDVDGGYTITIGPDGIGSRWELTDRDGGVTSHAVLFVRDAWDRMPRSARPRGHYDMIGDWVRVIVKPDWQPQPPALPEAFAFAAATFASAGSSASVGFVSP